MAARRQPHSTAESVASGSDLLDRLGHDAVGGPAAARGARPNRAPSDPADIEVIKRRIQQLLAARDKMPRPMPTAEFPLPPEDARCECCKRYYRDTPQPLKHRKSPFLEPSRPGSNDCIVCRSALPWGYKGCARAQVLEKLGVEENQLRYMLVVLLYEDQRNNPAECVVRAGAMIPGPLQMDIELSTQNVVSVGSEMILGIFWPLPLYIEKFKHQPPKSQITTHKHKGITYKGVVKDESFGAPIGCIRLNDSDVQQLTMNTRLNNGGGGEFVEQIFSSIRSRLTCIATREQGSLDPASSGGPGADATFKFKAKPASCGEDGMGDVFGSDFQFLCKKAGGRKAAAPSSAGSPRAGGAAGAASASAAGRAVKKSTKKQAQMDHSERVILAAKQVLSHVGNPDTAVDVSSKKLWSTVGQLKARCKPALIDLYSEDYSSATTSRTGMTILSEVRHFQQCLTTVATYVDAAYAEPFNSANFATAAAELVSASTGGKLLAAPTFVYKAWVSAANACLAAEKYADWLPIVERPHFFPADLPQSFDQVELEKFREMYITDTLLDLLRKESKEHVVRAMAPGLAAYAAARLPPSGGGAEPKVAACGFAADLLNLCKIALARGQPADVVEAVYAIKTGMTAPGAANYTARFARALQLFPTGIQLVAACDLEKAAVNAEAGCRLQMVAVREKVDLIAAPTIGVDIVVDIEPEKAPVTFSSAFLGKVTDAFARWMVLQSNATERFTSENSEALRAYEATMCAPVEQLFAAVRSKFTESVSEFHVALSAAIGRSTPMTSKDAEALVLRVMRMRSACAPSIAELELQRFTDTKKMKSEVLAALIVEYGEWQASASSLLDTISNAAPTLLRSISQSTQSDLFADHFLKLIKLLSGPGYVQLESHFGVSGAAAFKTAVIGHSRRRVFRLLMWKENKFVLMAQMGLELGGAFVSLLHILSNSDLGEVEMSDKCAQKLSGTLAASMSKWGTSIPCATVKELVQLATDYITSIRPALDLGKVPFASDKCGVAPASAAQTLPDGPDDSRDNVSVASDAHVASDAPLDVSIDGITCAPTVYQLNVARLRTTSLLAEATGKVDAARDCADDDAAKASAAEALLAALDSIAALADAMKDIATLSDAWLDADANHAASASQSISTMATTCGILKSVLSGQTCQLMSEVGTVAVQFMQLVIGNMQVHLDDLHGCESKLVAMDANDTVLSRDHRDDIYPEVMKPATKMLLDAVKWVSGPSSIGKKLSAALTAMGNTAGYAPSDVIVPFETDPILVRSAKLCGSMSYVVSLWRPLRADEERSLLVKKAVASTALYGGLMTPHSCIARAVASTECIEAIAGSAPAPADDDDDDCADENADAPEVTASDAAAGLASATALLAAAKAPARKRRRKGQ